jgi:beta-lactamase superfamily II metal-dependent hydrolase
MYNVGFGDAFLVLIPDGQRQCRVLFDCGSIEASKDMPMKGIVSQIIEDVTDEDGVARIDVVVATHRHKDHVSGFADVAWKAVEVKEVWLPWTEHPTDAEARRIREMQSRLALSLNASLATAASIDGSAKLLGVARDIAANALMLSNDAAMKTLHSGFAGKPKRRFLPLKGIRSRLIEPGVLPGVKVHVMGPSRDPEVIRDMDPPKGESYLRLRSALAGASSSPPPPFAPEFRLESSVGEWVFPPWEKDEVARAGSLSELAVAVVLDKAVNGTSLMLMIEVGGSLLLFPGDAQWGTWANVLGDDEWREMLQRVNFYKIGHHGSHNATPRKFVSDLMPPNCCTMASTLTRKIWPEIPRLPLLNGLRKKAAKIARSDKPDQADRTFKIREGVIEAFIAI